jgi:DNA-binding transcriptional LysR family regulator
MNLRRLKYFVIVAEEENLHRASVRLHVAQPALTRQIRLLEEELGTVLFDRLPRGISLSIAGQSFLEDARQILRLTDQAQKRAQAVAGGQLGTLRVGFHDAAHFYSVLRNVFWNFRGEFENVHFRFLSTSSDYQIDSLVANDLDVGFIYKWDTVTDALTYLSLTKDHLVLALNVDHRLAQKDVVTADDLRHEKFVWGDSVAYRGHTDAILRACAKIGFIPDAWHQGLSGSTAMISMVASGMGVAIVPRQTVKHERVTIRPIENLNTTVELLLAWNPTNTSVALPNFIRHAREQAALSQLDSAAEL